MENNPRLASELRAMGFAVLPVTVVSGTPIAGFDVPALKKLLHIDAELPRDLDACELLGKFRLLYAASRRAVSQIPEAQLDWVTPQKERRGQTLRQLAFHLFDRPDVCMNAARSGRYTYDMCHEYEQAAHGYRTTQSLLDYADLIMDRLGKFLTDEPAALAQTVDTYFGPQTVGKLLNMALAGLALRIKQTYYFQRAIGITPQDPLEEKDFAGILVPGKIFG